MFSLTNFGLTLSHSRRLLSESNLLKDLPQTPQRRSPAVSREDVVLSGIEGDGGEREGGGTERVEVGEGAERVCGLGD